ncbi:MAG: zinc ribbon domain-containing protein [Candidatus Methanomethylophilaceae archaeon]|nr:zinc ribbon domain-containing protein [Candidatus Methanomethylophilaceae archaeon]
MTRLCWKCHRPHDDDDAEVCPYCGAEFAPQDSSYKADGRTITTEDDSAYLTSAPPKYRKNYTAVFGVVLAVGIALVAITMMIGNSGILDPSEPDIEYDYTLADQSRSDGYAVYTYNFMMTNYNEEVIDQSRISFTIDCKGRTYVPSDITVEISGLVYAGTVTFKVPDDLAEYGPELRIDADGYSIHRTRIMPVSG